MSVGLLVDLLKVSFWRGSAWGFVVEGCWEEDLRCNIAIGFLSFIALFLRPLAVVFVVDCLDELSAGGSYE